MPKRTPKKEQVDPKVAEKQDRFKRLFPKRVEALIRTLKVVTNCSVKSSYEWNQDLIRRTWIEIAKHFVSSARCYGVDFIVTVDGQDCREVDTSSKRKGRGTRKPTK